MNTALKTTKKGFTLIELLIVIAIIAILALVLVPKIGTMTNEAKNTGTTQNSNIILGTIENVLGKAVLEPVTSAQLTTELGKLGVKNTVTKSGIAYKILDTNMAAEVSPVPGCIYLEITTGTASDIAGVTLHRVLADGTVLQPLLVAGN